MNELLKKFAQLGDDAQFYIDIAKDHCQTPEIPFQDSLHLLIIARDLLNEMVQVGNEIIKEEKEIYGES